MTTIAEKAARDFLDRLELKADLSRAAKWLRNSGAPGLAESVETARELLQPVHPEKGDR